MGSEDGTEALTWAQQALYLGKHRFRVALADLRCLLVLLLLPVLCLQACAIMFSFKFFLKLDVCMG